MVPECLGRSGGIQNVGMLEGPNIKMTLDMCHPTAQTVTERRPDLVMWRKSGKQIHFLEVACAWDPLAKECDFKNQKNIYAKLAKDLINQHPGHKVMVQPLIVWTMGLVIGARHNLRDMGLFPTLAGVGLVREIQQEVLYNMVRILKRHMAMHGNLK